MHRSLLLLVAVSGVFATGADDKPTAEEKALQGSWSWDPAAKQSEAKPVILTDGIAIDGKKLTIHYSFDGKKFSSECEFKIDPSTTPKQMEFTPVEGANKGGTYHGIYHLDADGLRIAYRGPGATRPNDFTDMADRKSNQTTVFIQVKPSKRNMDQ